MKPPLEAIPMLTTLECVPLSVLLDKGAVTIVLVPKMSASELAFFKGLLVQYERAIIIQEVATEAKHPSQGRVIGPGDTRTGEVAEDYTRSSDEVQAVDAPAPGG